MPGAEAIYAEDTVRLSEQDYQRYLSECLEAFTAADKAREPFMDRWERYYKLYRSYVRRDPKNWRSQAHMPIAFYIVETVAPKLVAQLPSFMVRPVGPGDAVGAEIMENLLSWCVDQPGSGSYDGMLFEQLVIAIKDMLIFGTGILKTYHNQVEARDRSMAEAVEASPIIDPMNGLPLSDQDTGRPILQVVGEEQAAYTTYMRYDGPAAEAVDIENFWIAPEASSIEDARSVIQRSIKTVDWVKQMVADGVFHFPPGKSIEEWSRTEDEPHARRMREIGLDVSPDPTRRPVEVMEFWYENPREVRTMLNRSCVVRVQNNPFDHQEKPFIRIVDQLVPHEFWGIGEIEAIEGLQDVYNALVNTRIDNVKLVLNSMFAVNIDHVYDQNDLAARPGGIVRVREPGLPVNQVFQKIDFGDVTSSSYMEAESVLNMVERTSGVSAYQLGNDSNTLNRTATGVSLITEQGNTRFALKMHLAEMSGFRRLARHFGSLLQQFMPPEMQFQVTEGASQMLSMGATQAMGVEGSFASVSPAEIQGRFNYDVVPMSSAQTESIRKEQAMTLYQLIATAIDPVTGMPMGNARAAIHDVLRAWGIKNEQDYILPPMMPPPALPGEGGAPAPEETPVA